MTLLNNFNCDSSNSQATSPVGIYFCSFIYNLNAKVSAESEVGKDVYKVVVSLFGITNSTKDIVALVNVKDQTKSKLFNAENPETEGEDKVSYVITFQNLSVDDGEPYTVC